MPLAALAVIAYAVGLLAGLGGVLVPAAAAALAAGALLLTRGERAGAALAGLALAGALAGALARRADAACAAHAVGHGSWDAVLVTDAVPGGFARATLVADGCAVAAGVGVATGPGRAGDAVRITGAASAAERGVRVRDAAVAPRADRSLGGWLARRRAAAGRAIDRVYGHDAPLARALLVADMAQVPAEVRDRFADAGLVHVLSVSGLHVAIVASAVQLVLGAARLGPRRAEAWAAGATLAYVALLGAPPPALRAGVMLAATAASRRWQRPVSPWSGLALGAAAPLALDPRAAADLGFQLSVAGMVALVAAGALRRRLVKPRLAGWRAHAAGELLTSVVATLVTLPIVAYAFGRVSVVGPLTNLAAGPVIALLQPTLFLGLLLAPVPRAAACAAAAAHPLLGALDGVARAGAAVPHAALPVWPSAWTAALLGAAAAAGVAACVARHAGRPLVVLGACAVVAAWWPGARGSGELEMHMLDVGQGDAIAVRTPRGRWLLFDAGPAWEGGDAGARVVVPYLARAGGAVAAFVLSHPHADHVGGAASAIRALRPAEYWDDGFVGTTPSYTASLEAARAAGARWRRATPGAELVVDGVRVRFLAPDSARAATLAEPNDASTVAMVEYGAVRFLLVGDAERGEEDWLLARRADVAADVLKVGHHGSVTSSSAAFLDAVRPRVALVSVGRGNTYGHPGGEVMRDLVARGADVLRTDQVGTVVVRTDGRRITINTRDAAWTLPSRTNLPAAAGGAR